MAIWTETQTYLFFGHYLDEQNISVYIKSALIGGHLTLTNIMLHFLDQDVFNLNVLYNVHSILALFKGNDVRLANLASEMQLHLDTLSSEQTSNLIGENYVEINCEQLNPASSFEYFKSFQSFAFSTWWSKALLVSPD